MEGCSSAAAACGIPVEPLEGCFKTSACAASSLPDGPLVEILSRVPAKSICHFKCVSKGWCDLIADPAIRKKLLPQAMQGLFVQTDEFSEDDGNKELVSINFSFIDLTVGSVPLDIDPSFSFLTEMTGIKTFFLDSCNGLVLFGRSQERSHASAGDYFVCNPTTKQWLGVAACGSRAALSHTYLAFDPAISSHFHLVQIQKPDRMKKVVSLHVYSSETGTWSQNQLEAQIDEQNDQGQLEGQIVEQNEQAQLEGWHNQFKLQVFDYHCAFVNGLLHLIVRGAGRQHILVLDIQGKARRIITLPGMTYVSQSHTDYLGQSQGHLHCVTVELADEISDNISMWVLQDYDTQEWVLKSTVNTLDVFGQLEEMPLYEVVDIHEDCNVLFFFQELTNRLIAYDMDRREVSVLATFQDCKARRDFTRYIPYFLESPALTNKH